MPELTDTEIITAIDVIMRLRMKELKMLTEFDGDEEEERELMEEVADKRSMLKGCAEYLQGCLDEIVPVGKGVVSQS